MKSLSPQKGACSFEGNVVWLEDSSFDQFFCRSNVSIYQLWIHHLLVSSDQASFPPIIASMASLQLKICL
ncbi:hypothetical protein ACOSQ4_000768 [Xanthoceras sorbifolium]